jgi:hypothetical protein
VQVPPGDSLPPEAIGAVMEVTKWLKPSISVSPMSGVWKRSQGRTSEAPPDERGGNRYVRPTATAPHSDSTALSPSPETVRLSQKVESGHSHQISAPAQLTDLVQRRRPPRRENPHRQGNGPRGEAPPQLMGANQSPRAARLSSPPTGSAKAPRSPSQHNTVTS